jgi:hypothetical protein
MRKTIFLAALLWVISSHAQTSIISKSFGPLKFIELDHGLASVVEDVEQKTTNSPTGTHGWLKDLVIVKVTDSIQVVKKANFGVVYQINSKDTVDIDVKIEWIYPLEIINEKGQKFKSIKYSTSRPTNTPSASSYSLDELYEMVKGNWLLNIYIEDKKVFSRSFVLY